MKEVSMNRQGKSLLVFLLACLFLPATGHGSGRVVCWGSNDMGQATAPAYATNIVAVAAGQMHSLALCDDGTVIAWGGNADGQGTVPAGLSNIVAIAAGDRFSMALASNGTVRTWGTLPSYITWSSWGIYDLDSIAGGANGGLFLTRSGLADYTIWPTTTLLATDVAAISAGGTQTCLLMREGSVVATLPPPAELTGISAIAVGQAHMLALASNGSAVAWGSNDYGETNVPFGADDLIAISANAHWNLALRRDGSLLAWGAAPSGWSTIANVVGIAAGGSHGVAIVSSNCPPVIVRQPLNQIIGAGSNMTVTVGAVSAMPITYQWQKNGTNLCVTQDGRLSIPGAQLTDSGVYSVTASNSVGTAISRDVTINISSQPPVIAAGFTNTVSLAGETATLSVSVPGWWMSYQWQFQGVDIPGATRSNLVLSNIQMNQAGMYSVTASNPYGTACWSNTVSVLPLAITTQPSDQNGLIYGVNQLMVVASSTAALSYQWQLDGTDLPKATSRKLLVTNSNFGAFGYTVIISNLYGAVTSRVATLTVTQVKGWGDTTTGFINVPAGATNVIDVTGNDSICVALRADKSVAAWGEQPEPGMENLQGITQIAAGFGHCAFLGADGRVRVWDRSPTLTNVPASVTNVAALAKGSGAWHVMALRKDGTVVTWGYSFTGMNTPREATNVIAVSVTAFECLALRGDSTVIKWSTRNGQLTNWPAQFQATDVVGIASAWYGDALLRANGTVVYWSGSPIGSDWAGYTNLVDVACSGHSAITLSDQSVVRDTSTPSQVISNCAAIGGSGFNGFAVVSYGPPVITSPSVDRFVPAGRTAYVRVTAVGARPLRYQWRFNGDDLPGATNQLLALTNIQFSQAGTYSVVVSNSLGLATNDDISVKVIPMMFDLLATNSLTFAGGTASFKAASGGAGPFSYQWRFNGASIDGATNSLLIMTNLSLSDSGLYSVIVSNDYGVVESTNALSVSPFLITNPPVAQCVTPGMDATFGVAVASTLPISFQWRFNGHDIDGATNCILVVTNPPFLAGEYFSSAGRYSVAISNALGGTVSDEVGLYVSKVGAWGYVSNAAAAITAGLTNLIDVGYGPAGLALQDDGTVLRLGDGACPISGVSNIVALGCSTALCEDGTVVSLSGEPIPDGLSNVVSLCNYTALCSDGRVVAWGDNTYGLTNVPPSVTNAVAIAEGLYHRLALRDDGTVLCWGNNQSYQLDVPLGLSNVVAVAAAAYYSLALKADGSVVGWGDYRSGNWGALTTATNLVGLAAGAGFGVGLRADGTVMSCGTNQYGSLAPLSSLRNVVAIRARNSAVYTLCADGAPMLRAVMESPTLDDTGLTVQIPTQSGQVYRLEYSDSLLGTWTPLPLVAGNGRVRVLKDSTAGKSQRFYRVRRW